MVKTGVMGGTGPAFSAFISFGRAILARRIREPANLARIQEIDSPKNVGLPITNPMTVPSATKSQNLRKGNPRFKAFVNTEKYAGCGICARVCPANAVIMNEVASVDTERCTGCGQCIGECPQNALTLKSVH